MSGGVDSSVAALLLKEQGYDVVGVTLHLWDYPEDGGTKGRCCAPEDVHDARRVADALGFPHYAFDRRELFEREVVRPFVEGYLAGDTPSPCVRCNRGVKVKELVTLADRLGARHVATGHYVRLERIDGRLHLLRGKDQNKDQSYFLHMLDDATLDRFVFPLGDLDKATVRALAVERNLVGAHKGESQELCFVPTGRYDEFVDARADSRARPGNIVDAEGRVLSAHAGIHRFTVGQRKNLGVATGQRAYVTDIDEATGTVRLGDKSDLEHREFFLEDVHLRDGEVLPLEGDVAVRYRGTPVRARLDAAGRSSTGANLFRVTTNAPVTAPTPGQTAVFYSGERVLGGGTIVRPPVVAAVDAQATSGRAEHAVQ